jgi:hypothetical protein
VSVSPAVTLMVVVDFYHSAAAVVGVDVLAGSIDPRVAADDLEVFADGAGVLPGHHQIGDFVDLGDAAPRARPLRQTLAWWPTTSRTVRHQRRCRASQGASGVIAGNTWIRRSSALRYPWSLRHGCCPDQRSRPTVRRRPPVPRTDPRSVRATSASGEVPAAGQVEVVNPRRRLDQGARTAQAATSYSGRPRRRQR